MSTPIQVGDYVTFPKGTPLFSRGHPETSFRKQTKRVKEIITDRLELVERLMTADDARRVEVARHSNGGHGTWITNDRRAREAIADEVLARHAGQTLTLLWFGEQCAFVDTVTKVDPPVPKAKPLTKMQQMVPKSIWRLTQAIDIIVPIENAAYWEETSKNWKLIRAMTGVSHSRQNELHAEKMRECGISKFRDLSYLHIDEGTEIVVAGKRTQYINYGPDYSSHYTGKSFVYPFKFPEAGATWLSDIRHREMQIPYDLIGPYIEPVDVPQVRVWVMRDTETGKFFKEAESGYAGVREGGIVMVGSYHEARKYGDLGLLKTSVMDWTGYHSGMPENVADRRPDWMQYGSTEKVADLPPTFEAVCYDKLAKAELPEVTTDLQDWNTRLWKLRDLTINHGSIVRKLYNDIDKKGEIEKFSYILTLRTPIDEYNCYLRELTADEIAAFEDIIERSDLKRTEMRRGKNDHSIAVAVRDPNIAFQMKMFYGGPLRMSVLNMRTLEEEVR